MCVSAARPCTPAQVSGKTILTLHKGNKPGVLLSMMFPVVAEDKNEAVSLVVMLFERTVSALYAAAQHNAFGWPRVACCINGQTH